jgi:hypothetical protein
MRIPRPPYVLIGSLSALALYFLTTPATRLSEYNVGESGVFGAAIGYGVERFVVYRRHRTSPHTLEKCVGLNRHAKTFLAILSAFLLVFFAFSYLVLLAWTGWGSVYLE